MIPHPRKWFKKSKKTVESPISEATDSPDVAMSELAASLQKEIQGLSAEIKNLRTEREGLFRPRPPSMCRKQSTQSLWLPLPSVPPIPENEAAPKVEMGLFGPRSRTPSINASSPAAPTSAPEKAGSVPSSPTIAPASPTVGVGSPSGGRRRPIRSMSEGSLSLNNPDAPVTPTRTAWRVVDRKPESIYLARA
ncbi:hypothetical protein C0991_005160 [Blastosporella zonata]|nr:hypothetical protein C0991_005160 [Blastosporella zonata]